MRGRVLRCEPQHGGGFGYAKLAVAPPSRGTGVSRPLEEQAEFLLALIEEQPDLALDEVIGAMLKCRIPDSRTVV